MSAIDEGLEEPPDTNRSPVNLTNNNAELEEDFLKYLDDFKPEDASEIKLQEDIDQSQNPVNVPNETDSSDPDAKNGKMNKR